MFATWRTKNVLSHGMLWWVVWRLMSVCTWNPTIATRLTMASPSTILIISDHSTNDSLEDQLMDNTEELAYFWALASIVTSMTAMIEKQLRQHLAKSAGRIACMETFSEQLSHQVEEGRTGLTEALREWMNDSMMVALPHQRGLMKTQATLKHWWSWEQRWLLVQQGERRNNLWFALTWNLIHDFAWTIHNKKYSCCIAGLAAECPDQSFVTTSSLSLCSMCCWHVANYMTKKSASYTSDAYIAMLSMCAICSCAINDSNSDFPSERKQPLFKSIQNNIVRRIKDVHYSETTKHDDV